MMNCTILTFEGLNKSPVKHNSCLHIANTQLAAFCVICPNLRPKPKASVMMGIMRKEIIKLAKASQPISSEKITFQKPRRARVWLKTVI